MKKIALTLLACSFFSIGAASGQDFAWETNANETSVTITRYVGSNSIVVIPTNIDGLAVTGIGEAAFYQRHDVTNVVVGAGITGIADWAFYNSGLVSITFPPTLNEIGLAAFEDCHALTNAVIPDSLTNLGQSAFSDCLSLSSARIPAGLTNIGLVAFGGCLNMTAITVDPQNSFYSSKDEALFDKSQSTLIEIPAGFEGPFLIPETVTNIAYWAGGACAKMTGLTIGGRVSAMGEGSFYGGTNLASLIISNGVSDIGLEAFGFCDTLQSVSIPGSVTNFGVYAFEFCGDLTNVSIGDGVPYLPDAAFYYCIRLEHVSIPASVTDIGSAFCGCSALASVGIPESLTNLGDSAFCYCGNLSEITIPGRVSDIGAFAFQGCNSMTRIFFSGNAPTVGPYAFDGDASAIAYYLPGTTGWDEFSTNGIPAVLWNPEIQTGGSGFDVQNNQFGFNITGTTGIPIEVEACTNLANPIWEPLQSLTVTNGLVHFSEPFSAANPSRFYRITAP